MSLKIKISEDLKSAMKEKNAGKLSILRVLKGEIERNEQSANGKIELTEGDIIKLVKKLTEGIKETTNNQDEISLLEGYLPKQITEQYIREKVERLRVIDGFATMGEYMTFFKKNYDGRYDGKVLSTIVKEKLA